MWLLLSEIFSAIQRATEAGFVPTAEQQAAYEARYGYDAGAAPRILTAAGDVAEISVQGVITKAPSFLAMIFGGGNVTYNDITAALAIADSDPAVKRIDMKIDSPGGTVDGLFDTLAAMQATKKPIRAVVSNTAASAAYALATQAGEIVATNRATRFGSVGTATSYAIDDSIVELTSTEAPNKRPDIKTEAGKAVIIEQLDALHALFAEAIATGRGTTVEQVNATYGRGSTLLADEAVKRGMIDAIAEPVLRVVKSPSKNTKPTQTATSGDNPEATNMDLNTLKAQHPGVYQAAVQDGIAKERDRVSAHLTAGTMSGDLTTAIAAAQDGTEMTTALQTKYLMTAANRRDQSNRSADDADAAAAANKPAAPTAETESAAVLAVVQNGLGIAGGESHV